MEYLHSGACGARVFEDWVRYSAGDAFLTHRLYAFARGELEGTQWRTSVVAEDGGGEQARAAQTGTTSGRRPQARSSVGGGKSMWDFYAQEYRAFAVLLHDMETCGVGVDMRKLEEMRQRAEADQERAHADAVEWLTEN